MTVVSYRLYCQTDGCANEGVVRKDSIEESNWKIVDLYHHEGICPACNDVVDLDADDEYSRDKQRVAFEELDAIGEAGANNLRERGIVTHHDVKVASDEDILDTSWVGEKGLNSIRQEVQE